MSRMRRENKLRIEWLKFRRGAETPRFRTMRIQGRPILVEFCDLPLGCNSDARFSRMYWRRGRVKLKNFRERMKASKA